ncbi:diaminopimelate decarboxylase [Campylobacter sp. RKI_CA19_01128]|uniref:diaminopimelate decarboxylase n=1 Tax=unclassified Campylobacter TaxID=2593542 RepID=UPI0021E948BA|nr:MULTISPECIES: diaminopimelate decarboxylase [unclassified Campylobacter]HEC1769712.1 diaminopimelate decarboxylase [Campylobacter lari]MCV3349228.1 diaminopimelate decarboxylase [Campylobacter sp. RKI_CA19_01127]MCV3355140.1 diaminopimelate decarboxylase [Campylobacter sp. RKI_CA19_01128]HEC1776693.1 diaminopimelate decarboxylase [Campylobacter lari]HEC1777265.1 diaminopimelate decarboxylase [Campylobacter lari]
MDYLKLAKEYNTPFYIYDFDKIKERFTMLKDAFKARKSQIFYAVKANSNLSVLKLLASLDSGFDCVSAGEIYRALKAGAKNYKIIFSGVGKSADELKYALEQNILYVNLESYEEMLLLEQIAKENQKTARISIRVNPNVDAKTHPYISTGLHENKFGVDIESAKKMYLYAKNSQFLEPVGVHFHIGSQILDISSIHEASAIVAKLVKELLALKINIKFFDIGGGLGVCYKDEQEPNLYDYAQGILASLQGLDVCIGMEPGRFLVANAGEFVTKVLYEKFNDKKRFVIVDGAMNDLLRPSLYSAYHEIKLLSENKEESLCDIVGGICESGDFLAKDRKLAKTKAGDLIIVKSAGAYGFSMSSNYNTRNRVCELACENGTVRMIRKRESYEDQIALELDFLKD